MMNSCLKKNDKSNDKEYVDLNSIRNMFILEDTSLFPIYLKEIYKDLIDRAESNKKLGMSRITFYEYIKLPVFIADKLYNTFDKDNNGYLNVKEFITGMNNLYYGSFKEIAYLLFQIYDFNKDGLIHKADIKILLSYLPLKNEEKQNDAQKEIDSMLKMYDNEINFNSFFEVIKDKSDIFLQLLCFLYENTPFSLEAVEACKSFKKQQDLLNTPTTTNTRNTSNQNQKKNNLVNSINNHSEGKDNHIFNTQKISIGTPVSKPIKVIEKIRLSNPCKTTAFKPADNIFKLMQIEDFVLDDIADDEEIKVILPVFPNNDSGSKNKLNNKLEVANTNEMIRMPNLIGGITTDPKFTSPSVFFKHAKNEDLDELDKLDRLEDLEEKGMGFKAGNSKKLVNSIINLENTGNVKPNNLFDKPTSTSVLNEEKQDKKVIMNHLISMKQSYNINSNNFNGNIPANTSHTTNLSNNKKNDISPQQLTLSPNMPTILFNNNPLENSTNNINNNTGTTSNNTINSYTGNLNNPDPLTPNTNNLIPRKRTSSNVLSKGGTIYKISDNKNLKIYYLYMLNKDIYYYKNSNRDELQGMHNLSGTFIQSSPVKTEFQGKVFYSFSILFSNRTRTYYCTSKEEVDSWVLNMKEAIGYQNFADSYEMSKTLGEGKFGLVKLGVHKKTEGKVAIKIIRKENMLYKDQELVKSEIDIMKICKHENIVRLLDHFENNEYIFIVMEYLSYGTLAQYLESTSINDINEQQCAYIIFQLSRALEYLHQYGIVHRDLKPENIMMSTPLPYTTYTSSKIMDFGLSKILGPMEVVNDGFGTLTYVAPEVFTRKPYNKQVDIWSLGVITYYILSGTYPFDDDSNNEEVIAKKTVFNDLSFYHNSWATRTPKCKDFINKCLTKKIDKRIKTNDLLTHPWFKDMKIN